MKKFILAALILSTMLPNSNAQLTATTGLSTVQLENLLSGLGVTISNVQVSCNSTSYGEFSGTSEIPISHGLIMTTGIIDSNLLGPNNYPNYSTDNSFIGDFDLTADAGIQTYDACVIQFDCVPAGDTLMFNFGFGSEEYPEYVGSSFNDIFAIYLTDSANVTINTALVPSTSVPVSTNNVNAITNSAYYIDNSAGVNIQFDGITQNLQAFAVVIPGNTYHFKIAIADAGDGIYDSGVLLEAFSFRSTPLIFSVENEISNSFVIYPNPADDYIQIQSKTNASVETILITDALGRIVLNKNIGSTSTSIDIGSLDTGLYLLTAFTEKGKFTRKILVK